MLFRSLFFELLRIVRLVRPRYVVLENVSAILTRGLGAVLGALAESGYDAWWDCIPAQAVGAPHRRDRWFCIAWGVGQADPRRSRQQRRRMPRQLATTPTARQGAEPQWQRVWDAAGDSSENVADPAGIGAGKSDHAPHAISVARAPRPVSRRGSAPSQGAGNGAPQSSVGGTPNGLSSGLDWATPPSGDAERGGRGDLLAQVKGRPNRHSGGVGALRPVEPWEAGTPRTAPRGPHHRDRLRCLGNAVVPQVAEVIGRQLLAIERGLT